MGITAAEVLDRWNTDLQYADALTYVSRYELEKCTQSVWNEIMRQEKASDQLVAVHRALSMELWLRQYMT